MTPTFIIADDHPFVLLGVRGVLESIYPDYDVVEAQDYTSLLAILDKGGRDFELIIVDLNMPGSKGLEGIQAVQRKCPDVPVMVISGTESQQAIDKVMAQGVIGYMFKSFSNDQMVTAIQTVMDGDTYIPQGNSDVLTQDEFLTPASSDFGAAALNRLPMGVIICDAKATVTFCNTHADDFIGLRDGLNVDHGKTLRLARSDETQELHNLISVAAQNRTSAREGGALSVTRPSYARAFSLLIVPLTQDQHAGAQGAVAIFVTDPERYNEPPTAILARLYGLTDAEARLLQALIVGKKLETVAEENGVSLNTVRSHLKQVFRKTDTNRQPELVSLVMNSSAYVASNPVRIDGAEDDF